LFAIRRNYREYYDCRLFTWPRVPAILPSLEQLIISLIFTADCYKLYIRRAHDVPFRNRQRKRPRQITSSLELNSSMTFNSIFKLSIRAKEHDRPRLNIISGLFLQWKIIHLSVPLLPREVELNTLIVKSAPLETRAWIVTIPPGCSLPLHDSLSSHCSFAPTLLSLVLPLRSFRGDGDFRLHPASKGAAWYKMCRVKCSSHRGYGTFAPNVFPFLKFSAEFNSRIYRASLQFVLRARSFHYSSAENTTPMRTYRCIIFNVTPTRVILFFYMLHLQDTS